MSDAADTMKPETLEQVGEALYGAMWRTALAQHLGINERTVRRWSAGTSPIPDGVGADVRKLVRDRISKLASLAEKL
ncbi:MAG: transcriptional regulator [Alphaproteobacteria bacterium]|nr:transcriptional regulator [Alphaproteobacteria bacterium]